MTQPRIADEPEYAQPRETQHKAELTHRYVARFELKVLALGSLPRTITRSRGDVGE